MAAVVIRHKRRNPHLFVDQWGIFAVLVYWVLALIVGFAAWLVIRH